MTALQPAARTADTGRHRRLAASTRGSVRTRAPLCVPHPPPPLCQVDCQSSLMWKTVHPEAISSAQGREQGKHGRFLPPSPWQREMDDNWGWGAACKGSGRPAKPARAKKEHMVVVCGSDTSRKITLSRAPDHLTAVGTGPALSPSQM